MRCFALLTVFLGVKAYVAPTASELATATIASERPQGPTHNEIVTWPRFDLLSIQDQELQLDYTKCKKGPPREGGPPTACCNYVVWQCFQHCIHQNLCHRWEHFDDTCSVSPAPPSPLCCLGLADDEEWIQCIINVLASRPEPLIDPSELGSSLADIPDFGVVEFKKPETCCSNVETVMECGLRNFCHRYPKIIGKDVCRHVSKPEEPLCCKHAKGSEAFENCMFDMLCDRDPSIPVCEESNRAAGLALGGRTALDVFTAVESTKPKECCDFDDEEAFMQCIGQNLCHESPSKPECKARNPGPPPEPLCCPDAPNHEAYLECLANIFCRKIPMPICKQAFETVDGLIAHLGDSSSFDAVEVTEPEECCAFGDQVEFLQCMLENLCKHWPNDPDCKDLKPSPPSEPLCCEDAPDDEEYAKCMKELLCRHIKSASGCEAAFDTVDGLIPQLVEFSSALEATN